MLDSINFFGVQKDINNILNATNLEHQTRWGGIFKYGLP